MDNIDAADTAASSYAMNERTNDLQDRLELESVTSEDEDYNSAPPDYQITTYPADFTLEVLYNKWKAGDIVIPKFQRDFVWNQVQASKLIESFLVGLPIPAVFLYREKDSEKHLVIDGQQRLLSTFYYFSGIFGSQENSRIFNLKGLNEASSFYEKRFEDLLEAEQRRLKNAVLRAFIVQQIDPNDDTSMYHIFERLNTGGTFLANQEIRNCLYHGKFVEFLEDINRFQKWREILGKSEVDRRRKDIELIVRFLAMRDISAYSPPMKDFLSTYMRKNQSPSEKILKQIRKLFERTCEQIVSNLGGKPFHVRAGLNPATFDTVMVAFSKRLDRIPEDIEQRYRRLVEDENFVQITREGTTQEKSVKLRFEQASKRLFE